jgi:hypothetical protein
MPHAACTGGEIRADAAYTIPDFLRLTGLGAKSLRRAKREGLPVIRCGRRAYVRGADWLAHLARKVEAAK